jgi:hypothetical protein
MFRLISSIFFCIIAAPLFAQVVVSDNPGAESTDTTLIFKVESQETERFSVRDSGGVQIKGLLMAMWFIRQWTSRA